MTKDQVRSTEEALDLSLEALEESLYATTAKSQFLAFEAITAIKQARSAPVQEPVAWMHVMDNTEGLKANGKGIVSITQKRKHPFGKPGVDFSKSYPVTSTPLYTTPPAAQRQWVGLTDEERGQAINANFGNGLWHMAKDIEAKLKEKNT